jgi:hypothetical protein
MTDRREFWQKHLRMLSDTDLCAVKFKSRRMKRDELRALLEVLYERYRANPSPEHHFHAVRDLWFNKWAPLCVDCGVDVHETGEYYMLHDAVWNSAWIGRYRSPIGLDGQLCIGCLERRLGRTLMHCDFTDGPVNKERSPRSDRLRDRLTTKTGSMTFDGMIAWAVEGMLEKFA